MGPRLETWINGALVSIDIDEVWLEVFAKWDALVETDTASKIATAVYDILKDKVNENESR